MPEIKVGRIYDAPGARDGARVLVDRVWPRGLTKEKAELTEWCKEVAPTTVLRQWYGHDPAKYEEFKTRYHRELEQPEQADALEHLRQLGRSQTLTLLTATKDPDTSQAAVLAELLRE